MAFTSDVHNASNNTSATRLGNWIDNVEGMSQYGPIDAMGFCGDMGSASGSGDSWWGYVQSVMDVAEAKVPQVVYTSGNHEFYNGSFATTTNATKSKYIVGDWGVKDGSNFRIYCLGTDNWDNNQDNYTTAQVELLKNALASVDNSKAIFVITHYPLHSYGSGNSWSSRATTNADLVIEALNEAADSGKTIVLLWGHNHSLSDTNYDQIFDPGSSLTYDRNGNTKKINFYYAAAGCMSDTDYNSASASVLGKGLVVTVGSDLALDFAYFNADGKDVTEGHTSGGDDPTPTPGTSTKYVEVAASEVVAGKDYVIAGKGAADTTVYGIKNAGGSSTSGSEASTSSLTVSVDDEGKNYVSVSDSSMVWRSATAGEGLSMSNSGVYLFPGSDAVVRTYNEERPLLIDDNGVIAFASTHNYDGQIFYMTCSTSGSLATTDAEASATQFRFFEKTSESGDDPTPGTGNVYYEVGSFTAGKNYVLVSEADSTAYAIEYASSGSTLNGKVVTINPATDDKAANVVVSDANLVWNRTSEGYLKGNGSSYLSPGYSDIVSTTGSAIDYSDGYLTREGRNGVYYLTLSGSTFGKSTTASDGVKFRIFEQSDESGEDPTPIPTPGEGVDYKLVDAPKDGGEYLIVNTNAAGSAYALKNPGGSSNGASMGATSVTVSSDKVITTDATDVVWTVKNNGEGFNLTNGKDYLEGKSGNVKIYSAQQYPERYWTYTGNQLQHVGGQNTYTVYYSGGFTSTYNSTSEKVYFYEKTDTPQPVVVPVDSVTLSETSIELDVDGTATLTATVSPDNATNKDVTWTSSDESVATVDENGVVTAVGAGTATITATADGKSATCDVTVNEPAPVPTPASISVISAPTLFNVGDEFTTEGMEVAVTYSDGAVVKVEDVDVDSSAVDMTKAGTYPVTVSFTENGTTVTATYDVTVEDVAPVETTWKRLAGDDRYETMDAIVEEGFASSDYAVLASGANFPDALAASSIAGKYGCPVILTAKGSLSKQAKEEIERLGCKKVFIIGGEGSVSADVAAEVAKSCAVERIAGESRQATSLEVAKAVAGDGADTVVVASGVKKVDKKDKKKETNFADALSIGPWCYATSTPIILTGNDKLLTGEQVAALKAMGVKNLVIVGGDASVDKAGVAKQLGISEKNVQRLAGDDRYETSAQIALFELAAGMKMTNVAVATGATFPDALAGAALCGANDSVLLLAKDTESVTLELVYKNAGIETGYVLGGESSVSAELFEYLENKTK